MKTKNITLNGIKIYYTQVIKGINAIQSIKEDIRNGNTSTLRKGICGLIMDKNTAWSISCYLSSYDVLSKWKYWSGDKRYPIKSTLHGCTPEESYIINYQYNSLWVKTNYWYRIRLLNYWLKTLIELKELMESGYEKR